ncbi:predicted protein [Streptomyces pristinaespiralis ATCC 25486]|uniref:Predicted protein n=1 Tax=Streptomyces pristinaespiralis (strain ATCC 25486 / DSM 40338 / CBS 914.69 / JCM 4507 / KCC S-0507 / NBRC 13074 / NRRL 2958 / 5647) TaxID=457429 RepID=D6X9U1_STRE2|nr:predicted protein [Streptomyces pristinaespiralis ATCC 25486]
MHVRIHLSEGSDRLDAGAPHEVPHAGGTVVRRTVAVGSRVVRHTVAGTSCRVRRTVTGTSCRARRRAAGGSRAVRRTVTGTSCRARRTVAGVSEVVRRTGVRGAGRPPASEVTGAPRTRSAGTRPTRRIVRAATEPRR